MVFAIVVGVISVWVLEPTKIANSPQSMTILLAGVLLLFVLGALDDLYDLNCNLKILVELSVAAMATFAGWKIEVIQIWPNVLVDLGLFAMPVSVLWIAGVVNAVNIIDGLDGLAASIMIVSSMAIAAIAAVFGHYVIVAFAIVFAGSVIGFLRYNLFPASIFMGDSGSLPLGFLLATLSLAAASVAPGNVYLLLPVLVLAVPLADTTFAILRRLKKRIHPFKADQEHIHHRLVRSGKTQNGTVLLLSGLTFIFGVLAILLMFVPHFF